MVCVSVRALFPLVLPWFAAMVVAPHAVADSDPPGRVARINFMRGNVSFEPAGSNAWAYAELNRPLTNGDQLWTENDARAELHVGSTAIRVADQTGLQFTNVDDRDVQYKVSQGRVRMQVRALPDSDNDEMDTPNLALVAQSPGDYRVDVDPANNLTTVTVFNGMAMLYGAKGESLTIGSNMQMRFTGTQLAEVGPSNQPTYDAFDQWVAERNQRENRGMSARYVSPDMTGADDLDDYGSWNDDPEYGPVWTPTRVYAGWAPYHDGHWVWVAPWGWTWVAAEPWGFAPCHYGRWVFLRRGWAWVPGPRVERAVYAPAVVGFVGGGAPRGRQPDVAWFPLAPGEAYHPAYHVSEGYLSRVNAGGPRGMDRPAQNRYMNANLPHAVSTMPVSAFVGGHGVGGGHFAAPHGDFSHAPVFGAPPGVAPSSQSMAGARPHAGFTPPMNRMPIIAVHSPAGGTWHSHDESAPSSSEPRPDHERRPAPTPHTGFSPEHSPIQGAIPHREDGNDQRAPAVIAPERSNHGSGMSHDRAPVREGDRDHGRWGGGDVRANDAENGALPHDSGRHSEDGNGQRTPVVMAPDRANRGAGGGHDWGQSNGGAQGHSSRSGENHSNGAENGASAHDAGNHSNAGRSGDSQNHPGHNDSASSHDHHAESSGQSSGNGHKKGR